MTRRERTSVDTAARPKLHEVKPRELVGRDVIARFQSQFRAAALASLRILEGKELDRVYCDLHDDFVTRETVHGVSAYHFVQVKTKRTHKHQWTRLELFGIPKKVPPVVKGAHAPGGILAASPDSEQSARIRGSFIGKLLEHTINFGGSCSTVTFLTNVHLEDDVEAIAQAISIGDIGERTVRYLSDNFVVVFEIASPLDMSWIHRQILKLRLSPDEDYLDPDHSDFETKAKQAVWDYSEIDLTHGEGVELVDKLLALIEKKSSAKLIAELTLADLESAAGVSIDDLLEFLPVSRGAYYLFLKGGDASALKSASILQRKLAQAGATPEIIETASHWKVAWDNWFRTNRHTYEREITFLQLDLNAICARWVRGQVSFEGLQGEVGKLKVNISSGALGTILTEEILTGGILAELVRSESR